MDFSLASVSLYKLWGIVCMLLRRMCCESIHISDWLINTIMQHHWSVLLHKSFSTMLSSLSLLHCKIPIVKPNILTPLLSADAQWTEIFSKPAFGRHPHVKRLTWSTLCIHSPVGLVLFWKTASAEPSSSVCPSKHCLTKTLLKSFLPF